MPPDPSRAAKRAAGAACALLSLAWPVAAVLAANLGLMREFLWLGAALFGLRALLPAGKGLPVSRITSALGFALCAAGLLLARDEIAFWYPVIVNAALLFVFARSLFAGPSAAERFARLAHPEGLPPEAVSYCRKATAAWCGFFAANGAIAFATVMIRDAALWMLWNGCLSYIAIGLFALAEYLVRRRVQKHAARASLP